jgi:RNA polymerase sigma-70 factor (ECF subfamily)
MGPTTFDEQYVSRLTEGDPETEHHFVSYFGNLLLIKLRSRLRSRQHIDDVRQETLLRVLFALRRKGGVAQPERLGAFVSSTCNHVLLELFRAQSRTVPMPIDPPERADEAPSAESELIGQERKDTVRRVLAELPEKDQQVLKLLFYQDTPKDEVCRQFQVDRGYLRVLLYRAKKRFRELLEQTPISSARHETKRDYLSQGR